MICTRSIHEAVLRLTAQMQQVRSLIKTLLTSNMAICPSKRPALNEPFDYRGIRFSTIQFFSRPGITICLHTSVFAFAEQIGPQMARYQRNLGKRPICHVYRTLRAEYVCLLMFVFTPLSLLRLLRPGSASQTS